MTWGRAGAAAALVLACALGAVGALYFGRGGLLPTDRVIEGERHPLPPDERPRTVALAFNGDGVGRPGFERVAAPGVGETGAGETVPATPAPGAVAPDGTPPAA